jgi:hypothetical protein
MSGAGRVWPELSGRRRRGSLDIIVGAPLTDAFLSKLDFPGARPPPSRTKWIRRVPRPVLSGHAASLTPY